MYTKPTILMLILKSKFSAFLKKFCLKQISKSILFPLLNAKQYFINESRVILDKGLNSQRLCGYFI